MRVVRNTRERGDRTGHNAETGAFERRTRWAALPWYALTGTLLPLCVTTVLLLEALQVVEGLTGSRVVAEAVVSLIPFALMAAGLVTGWRSTVGTVLLMCGASALSMAVPTAPLPLPAPATAVVVLTAFACASLNLLEDQRRMRDNVEEGRPLFS